jgi:hypothetical protein
MDMARASRQLLPLYTSHTFHVDRCEITGETASALAHAREAVTLSERMGSHFPRMLPISHSGVLMF